MLHSTPQPARVGRSAHDRATGGVSRLATVTTPKLLGPPRALHSILVGGRELGTRCEARSALGRRSSSGIGVESAAGHVCGVRYDSWASTVRPGGSVRARSSSAAV